MNSDMSGLEEREMVDEQHNRSAAEQPSQQPVAGDSQTQPPAASEAAAAQTDTPDSDVVASAHPTAVEVAAIEQEAQEIVEGARSFMEEMQDLVDAAQAVAEGEAVFDTGTSADAPSEEAAAPTAEALEQAATSTAEETAAGETPAAESQADEAEHAAQTSVPAGTPAPVKNNNFNRGDLLEGTVTRTLPTAVYVDLGLNDLGEPVEGVIPGRELERMSRPMLEDLRPGNPVTVFVVNPFDHRGQVILSLNRALEEIDWREAENYHKSQQVYNGNIAGYNKGGLIVRFGRLRGFVPQSQLGDDRRALIEGETPENRWSQMINDEIGVKVVEVDRSRNRLILSERAASREVREKRKANLIESLTVGEVRSGRVVSLEDFGAFIDIGGAEGLVHLTELSWKHITHPRDFLRVGQQVTVEVISVDRERKRIGLSMKRQEADPWDEVATIYRVGELVQATVTKLTKFGAFAQLVDAPDIEGLIHISELSDQRVNHPREVVNEGDKLTLRVVKIDIKNRRLGLSLKRVNSAEYLDMDMRMFDKGTQDGES